MSMNNTNNNDYEICTYYSLILESILISICAIVIKSSIVIRENMKIDSVSIKINSCDLEIEYRKIILIEDNETCINLMPYVRLFLLRSNNILDMVRRNERDLKEICISAYHKKISLFCTILTIAIVIPT